jgi:hypothetical protein
MMHGQKNIKLRMFLLLHRENGNKVDDVKEGSRIKSFKKFRFRKGKKMKSSGEIASHVVKLPTLLFLFF